ncbi:MAG TPA: hypothetical protein PK872_06080 [Ferruginibacter sp.]|nr:hypothetical protein [Ferruginibacter sp.]
MPSMNKMMNEKIIFTEKQSFRQPLIWIILLSLNILFIYGFVEQVIRKEQFGEKPMTDTGLIILMLITLTLSLCFFSLRLETLIKPDGIYFRFYPFQIKYKSIAWKDLTEIYVRQYSPIAEYGGWGIRGIGKNKAYNVSGNKGIQLITTNNTRILIGTQKPDEINEIIKWLELPTRQDVSPHHR